MENDWDAREIQALEDRVERLSIRAKDTAAAADNALTPTERDRHEYDLGKIQASLIKVKAELDTLKRRVDATFAPNKQSLEEQLHRIEAKVDGLDNRFDGTNAAIIISKKEIIDTLLNRYDATTQEVLRVFLENMQPGQIAEINKAVESVDGSCITEAEIQEFSDEIAKAADEINNESAKRGLPLMPAIRELRRIMKEPMGERKQRLKIILPVIPRLVQYEVEYALSPDSKIVKMYDSIFRRLGLGPIEPPA